MGSFWFSWHMTSATTGKNSECLHFLLAPELEFLRELVLSRLQEWVVSGVEGVGVSIMKAQLSDHQRRILDAIHHAMLICDSA